MKASTLRIGLARALDTSKDRDLKHGQFPRGEGDDLVHAAMRHLTAVVGVADQVVARKNLLHHICLDYAYPRDPRTVNAPTALLLTNDAGSISIPIKWTMGAVSLAAPDGDVVVSIQAPFAGTLLSNHVIDIAVGFFGGAGQAQTPDEMKAAFQTMRVAR
ncbi:MAG: hypothetical protein ACK4MI_03920 [Brevundimonas sp.]|uniref:hypothetical protein n=1 Tax=Brevundimonas sp. TaxID=1871086 RepID=UPI00391D9FDC